MSLAKQYCSKHEYADDLSEALTGAADVNEVDQDFGSTTYQMKDGSAIAIDGPTVSHWDTVAEQFSERMGGDGTVFETADGTDFDTLAERKYGATVQYGDVWVDDDDEVQIEVVSLSEHTDGPVRFEFSDGSAVVVAGDCWDIEGATPFSFEGAS